MTDIENILAALAASDDRKRYTLSTAEKSQLRIAGLAKAMRQAAEIIDKNIAPARPVNDGTQTPQKGHPVYVAQHATATCCRRCLATWHGIDAGHALTPDERVHILAVLRQWLEQY